MSKTGAGRGIDTVKTPKIELLQGTKTGNMTITDVSEASAHLPESYIGKGERRRDEKENI